MTSLPSFPCPCGSSQRYPSCCGSFHVDEAVPSTPEALMRSRYSAFALALTDYLLETWHPDTRPASLDDATSTEWKRLVILEHGQTADSGWVRFHATFREGRRWAVLEEESRFVRHEGHWLYLDGTPSVSRLKPGRNAPCPCGSHAKFKACCGVQ